MTIVRSVLLVVEVPPISHSRYVVGRVPSYVGRVGGNRILLVVA